MGYTHYYSRPAELDADTFAHFAADARLVCLECGVNIAGPLATGTPEFRADLVAFNGRDELSHESFVIPQSYAPCEWEKPDEHDRYFGCCKTARKPYDIAVCAVLRVFKYHFGDDVHIATDGELSDWQPALDLCERVLGYAAELPYEEAHA